MTCKETPRNLFLTKTVRPLIGSALAFLALAAPHIGEITKRRLGEDAAKDINDIVSIIVVAGGLAGVGAAAHGRHQATNDVYTPWLLPGRKMHDYKEEEQTTQSQE
jgi:hypothetical protein